ncbi:MAG TPA: hypothetical protein VI912_00460 [Candidatus Bilamarchaeaceae archaeon]|nr:hypothetical protein [Candidatus Bilamarchaeaceae archaeon]
MRRIEYSDFQTKTDEKKVEPELKFEDTSLPFFSKEVPETSKKSEEEGIVTVNHVWNDVETPWVRIKTIHFLKDEELENLFSMNVRDGVERASVKKQGFTYVLRKVVKIVASSIFAAFRKTKMCIEKIVGHLTTTGGNTYLISRVDKGTWTFDKTTKDENIKHLTLDELDDSQKNRLFELITEGVIELHTNRFLVRGFSIENVLLTNERVFLSDPRNIRTTTRLSLLAEEFRAILKELVSLGMGRGQAYTAIATYVHKANDASTEWYKKEYGKNPKDVLELAGELERAVY